MPANGYSRRDENRRIREEDMRERIKSSGLLTQVLADVGEMRELASAMHGGDDSNLAETTAKINALQMVNNQRLKLLGKVLPELKAVDMDVAGDLKLVAIDMTGVHETVQDSDYAPPGTQAGDHPDTTTDQPGEAPTDA